LRSRFKDLCSAVMYARATSVVALLFALVLLVAAPTAVALPGDLDSSFDLDGRVTTDFGQPDEYGYAVAIQPDGKIVVLAQTTDVDEFVTTYVLLRYDSAGALDSTLDGDGVLEIGGMIPRDVAVQDDGKILLGGEVLIHSPDALSADFAVSRLDSTGSPDASFSDDGIATADFGGRFDNATAIAVEADGKIVLTGSSHKTGDFPEQLAVARFNSGGSPDMSFSDDGMQRTKFSGGPRGRTSVVVQLNGKVVIGCTVGDSNNDFGLARFNSNGTLDTTFSGDGKVRTKFLVTDQLFGLALQADGKILAAGFAGGPSGRDFALARYKLGGGLDPTFSKDGKLRTDFNGGEDDEARALLIQPNGRIVLAGFGAGFGSSSVFALARYRAGGKLDLSFSGNGKQLTKFGSGDSRRSHQIYDAALQADGRIVATGLASSVLNEWDVGLARYLTS
jgi:uncharacterized delta-60 repeat protein